MVQTMKQFQAIELQKQKVAETEAREMKIAGELKAESDHLARRAELDAEMEASDLREVEAIEAEIADIGDQLFNTPRKDQAPLSRQRDALRQRLHATHARVERTNARRIAADQTPTE